jgi:hypothetical protein
MWTATDWDTQLITAVYCCIFQVHWLHIITGQAHLSLLEGKLIIVPIQTADFTTSNLKHWYKEYKACVCLVWQSVCLSQFSHLLLSVPTVLWLYANTWTILWYPLQPFHCCCSVGFCLLFYCIYCCFYSANILWSQTCALPLNVPTLIWFSMAWWWLLVETSCQLTYWQ